MYEYLKEAMKDGIKFDKDRNSENREREMKFDSDQKEFIALVTEGLKQFQQSIDRDRGISKFIKNYPPSSVSKDDKKEYREDGCFAMPGEDIEQPPDLNESVEKRNIRERLKYLEKKHQKAIENICKLNSEIDEYVGKLKELSWEDSEREAQLKVRRFENSGEQPQEDWYDGKKVITQDDFPEIPKSGKSKAIKNPPDDGLSGEK